MEVVSLPRKARPIHCVLLTHEAVVFFHVHYWQHCLLWGWQGSSKLEGSGGTQPCSSSSHLQLELLPPDPAEVSVPAVVLLGQHTGGEELKLQNYGSMPEVFLRGTVSYLLVTLISNPRDLWSLSLSSSIVLMPPVWKGSTFLHARTSPSACVEVCGSCQHQGSALSRSISL